MFIFFCEIPKYVQAYNFYLMRAVSPVFAFMEVS